MRSSRRTASEPDVLIEVQAMATPDTEKELDVEMRRLRVVQACAPEIGGGGGGSKTE